MCRAEAAAAKGHMPSSPRMLVGTGGHAGGAMPGQQQGCTAGNDDSSGSMAWGGRFARAISSVPDAEGREGQASPSSLSPSLVAASSQRG